MCLVLKKMKRVIRGVRQQHSSILAPLLHTMTDVLAIGWCVVLREVLRDSHTLATRPRV